MSDIANGSNGNICFASRQILVGGGLLSDKPNFFNDFHSFFGYLVFYFIPKVSFFLFSELNFGLCFGLRCRFLHQHVILLT